MRSAQGIARSSWLCPGVVTFGMTSLWVWARREGEERSGLCGVLDGALFVGVRDESRGQLFVEGVPVLVRVVGLPRRLAATRSAVAQG